MSSAKTSKHIKEIADNGLLWVNATAQGAKELEELGRRFAFQEQDLKESLPPFQRPKIVKRENYYFMVLHFPVFDRETMRLGFTEVDFFLDSGRLVTVHNEKLSPIDALFYECKKSAAIRSKYFSGTAVHILFELISRLLDAIFPILLHVNDDINLVDRKLFSRNIGGREMAEEILRLKTNIVTFRRTMQGHRTVLERLIMYSGRDLDLASYQAYINSIREFTNEIWNMLESQKESINALHETNESLLSLRMNEIMRTLTVISVVTFPLALVVALFAADAPGNPFMAQAGGFWLLFSLVILGVILMVGIFKKRRWL